MQISPDQALAAASRRVHSQAVTLPELLIAGATGVLGNAVLRRLAGAGRYAHTRVLASEPMQQGMQQISLHHISGEVAQWPALEQRCDVALVMFEPPRMFYERERALWTPLPEQLNTLANWLHAQGARTLAVVLPHAQGSLPDALKSGLATLDEQALSALGFERVLIFRSAEKPVATSSAHPLERLAQWMLSIFNFMIPAHEQPVRPSKLAELVDAALLHAPPGTSVFGPQEVWAWAQMNSNEIVQSIARRWRDPAS